MWGTVADARRCVTQPVTRHSKGHPITFKDAQPDDETQPEEPGCRRPRASAESFRPKGRLGS